MSGAESDFMKRQSKSKTGKRAKRPLHAVVGWREWGILLKNPMWRGWKCLVRMYGCTHEQAKEEAKKAIHYYEGSTAWKVKPSNTKLSDGPNS